MVTRRTDCAAERQYSQTAVAAVMQFKVMRTALDPSFTVERDKTRALGGVRILWWLSLPVNSQLKRRNLGKLGGFARVRLDTGPAHSQAELSGGPDFGPWRNRGEDEKERREGGNPA
jgi:hypothetical protein